MKGESRCRGIFFTRQASPSLFEEFAAFRKSLFVDELGWSLNYISDLEIDQYDRDDTEYAAVLLSGKLIGGFRAIRCDRPYLTAEIFPSLSGDRAYPTHSCAWEISRLGLYPDYANVSLGNSLYGLMVRFAQVRSATSLVACVTLGHERLLKIAGFTCDRYGLPAVVGFDSAGREIHAVAGEIPIPEQTGPRFSKILVQSRSMEVNDAALSFRCRRVSRGSTEVSDGTRQVVA